jgi:hypothetical protein
LRDGDGEVSRVSSFAALVFPRNMPMFGFVESWRGVRFARFSGEKRKELSESFFLGAVPKRKAFPTMEEER